MKVVIATAPDVEPLTIDDAKNHLRLPPDIVNLIDDDNYLWSLIAAARTHVENLLGRALITQTWDYYRDGWPKGGHYKLPFGKLQSVTHVKYTDSDGTQNTWDTDEYIADITSDPGRVVLDYGESWPSDTLYPSNPIVTRFVCGYGDAGSDVPEPILHAVKLLIAEMYEQREVSIVGTVVTVQKTIDRLLAPYCLHWMGETE